VRLCRHSPMTAELPLPRCFSADGVRLGLIILVWYVLSSGYSLYAKIGLSEDRHATDIVLTLLQFLFGVVFSATALRGRYSLIASELWRGGSVLAVTSLGYALGALLTNTSLLHGSVAIAFVIKSTEPFIAVVLSRGVLGHRYDWNTLASLVPLCAGLALSCYQPSSGTAEAAAVFGVPLGAVLALLANAGMSVRNVGAKLQQVLSTPADGATAVAEEVPLAKMSPTDAGIVTFGAISAWSCLYGLLLLASDRRGQLHGWGLLSTLAATGGVSPTNGMLLISGACHAGYTICSFVVLQSLEPAAHSIVTALKQLFVIVSAALFLGSELSATQAVGGLLALIGVVWFGKARASDAFRREQAPSSVVLRALSSKTCVVIVVLGTLGCVSVLREMPL
jgi:drug/metabolite transporter (DMT)-like permease